MKILWKQKGAFLKEILDAMPEPKPAKTTVATLLKRMTKKDMIRYEQLGNSRKYIPSIAKKSYFSERFDEFKNTFFNDSSTQFASFFAKDTNLSISELEAIQKLIDEEIKKKKS